MSGNGIPILLYHAVDDRSAAGGCWGAVSRATFAAHMELVRASERAPMTISELTAGLRSERTFRQRPLAITFDDGYRDTLDAVTLLCENGLASTVYVTTSEIGARNRLSPREVIDLARMPGVELGAHAVHHRRLDELCPSEIAEEVRASKAWLEDLTGQRIDSFAYPHGAYDRRVRDAVIAAGYRSAAGVKNALCHRADDPFALSRWTVRAASGPGRVAQVIEGSDVPLGWTHERLRTRAYRAARRGRRRLRRRRSTPC